MSIAAFPHQRGSIITVSMSACNLNLSHAGINEHRAEGDKTPPGAMLTDNF